MTLDDLILELKAITERYPAAGAGTVTVGEMSDDVTQVTYCGETNIQTRMQDFIPLARALREGMDR